MLPSLDVIVYSTSTLWEIGIKIRHRTNNGNNGLHSLGENKVGQIEVNHPKLPRRSHSSSGEGLLAQAKEVRFLRKNPLI